MDVCREQLKAQELPIREQDQALVCRSIPRRREIKTGRGRLPANLCERKTRILKKKINQAISLRSIRHLECFCEYLSVIGHFATDDRNNLYQSIKEIFKRLRPVKPKQENIEPSDMALHE